MIHQLAYINGSTLRVIRERRGVSPEYLCTKARIRQDQLELWEQNSGSDYPTMNQAKSISKILLCPLAGLYLDPQNLPKETQPLLINKRLVQDAGMVDESALHLAVARLMQVRSDVIELASETGFKVMNTSFPWLSSNISDSASNLRDWIAFSLAEQIKTRSSRKLFLRLRACLEKRGILVVQFSNIEVEELRGIALSNTVFPVIGVNAKDRWPAKCFSLLHELVHLAGNKSTCCNLINRETVDEEEVYCNAIAGEFLLSKQCASMAIQNGIWPQNIADIEKLANRYSVSRDVVARRFRDCGYLSKEEYEEILELFATQLAEEIENARKLKLAGANKRWGSSYERGVADSYGSLFCELVAHGVSTGLLSERDACGVFNVNSEGLEKVFKEALG